MRLAVVLLVLAACGGETPIANAPSKQAAASTAGSPEEPVSSSIPRSSIARMVHAGLGSFLQTVALDEHPVFQDHKFHGFRIAGLAPQYARTGLVPGDVVTKVNGMPIERPEQAIEVFRSLEIASELHIDYERDGTPHELRLAIVDGQ